MAGEYNETENHFCKTIFNTLGLRMSCAFTTGAFVVITLHLEVDTEVSNVNNFLEIQVQIVHGNK